MATCDCYFSSGTYLVGDTLQAHFVWNGGSPSSGGMIAYGLIRKPNGDAVMSTYWEEYINSSGSIDKSCLADVEGVWSCLIEVWTGPTTTISDIGPTTVGNPTTTASCNFVSSNYEVGDTIIANFTWENGLPAGTGLIAFGGIRNPNGDDIPTAYWEDSVSTSHTTSTACVADTAGIWTCYINVWTGQTTVSDEGTTTISTGDGGGGGGGTEDIIMKNLPYILIGVGVVIMLSAFGD